MGANGNLVPFMSVVKFVQKTLVEGRVTDQDGSEFLKQKFNVDVTSLGYNDIVGGRMLLESIYSPWTRFSALNDDSSRHACFRYEVLELNMYSGRKILDLMMSIAQMFGFKVNTKLRLYLNNQPQFDELDMNALNDGQTQTISIYKQCADLQNANPAGGGESLSYMIRWG